MFHRQIAFPVEVDRLWEVLTDPDSMATWFGSTAEWELVPGGEIRVADEDGCRIGRVESVAAPHQLCFQWWPEHDDADVSEVTYHLEPADEGDPADHHRRTAAGRPAGPPPGAGGRNEGQLGALRHLRPDGGRRIRVSGVDGVGQSAGRRVVYDRRGPGCRRPLTG